MSDNPVDDVVIGARQMFAMFTALVEAGFTADQALTLVSEMLKNA